MTTGPKVSLFTKDCRHLNVSMMCVGVGVCVCVLCGDYCLALPCSLTDCCKEMSTKYTGSITETFEEDINCIKTYKPFYYNKKKDIIVTFNVPNALSNVRGLSKLVAGNMYGLMVKINADAKFYNFTDKDDNKKKH